jgi:GxxExxY protein
MFIETPHDGLTKLVIGCAMRVHSALGNGFPKVIYQRSLAIEFEKQKLSFSQEVHLPVFYEQREVGARRADFLVDNCLLLELKATSEITRLHYAQVINYLKAYNLPVGLLLNFGEDSLRYKRFIKSER